MVKNAKIQDFGNCIFDEQKMALLAAISFGA